MSWRIGVKHEQKEAVFRSQEDFPNRGSSSTPRCIFKRSARRILSTPALSGRNILVLSAEITDGTHLNLRPLVTFFKVRQEFFRPAFIRLNLVTALSRFREQCSLEDPEFKMYRNIKIHNCIATRN